MSNILLYKVQKYSSEYKKIFKGVYDDFKSRSFSDYKFELEPLEYDEFLKYVGEGFINCIIFLEDEIPTAFMVYTTEISESLELNIIHCLGNENTNLKRNLLLEKFFELERTLLEKKVTTYPMLGSQEQFVPDIANYGFKMVAVAVLRFNFRNPNSLETFSKFTPPFMQPEYRLTSWKNEYLEDIVDVVYSSFRETADAQFDPRFSSFEGAKDIVEKITQEVYGTFLPECTSVMLYDEKPVGVCFANITAGKIANIPVIGLKHGHCGKGLGEIMLHNTVKNLLAVKNLSLEEVNASTETDNYPALKMYRRLGFKEDYYYPQAYRPAGMPENTSSNNNEPPAIN